MEPGRDPQISAIGYDLDIIIASEAGVGQFTGEIVPVSRPKRMTQVVSAVMRKVQDATKQRLHEHAKAECIDGFVYAALGQIDRRVPFKPSNWVDRKEVIRYPTDFSAMSEENIRRFSGRGEAITRALVTQYLRPTELTVGLTMLGIPSLNHTSLHKCADPRRPGRTQRAVSLVAWRRSTQPRR